eukprot:7216952-Pyramimonas_sp.AAC.1
MHSASQPGHFFLKKPFAMCLQNTRRRLDISWAQILRVSAGRFHSSLSMAIKVRAFSKALVPRLMLPLICFLMRAPSPAYFSIAFLCFANESPSESVLG